MSSFADMGQSGGTEGAKILVFGAVGDKLKKLDPDRMMAVIQSDPDYFLAILGNMESIKAIDAIIEWANSDNTDDLPDTIKKEIFKTTKHDSLFKEIAQYLNDSNDILATGSFVTGEFEQKQAILKTMGSVPPQSSEVK